MEEQSIHILLVDDDRVDAELAQRALSKISRPRFTVQHVSSLSEAEEDLRGDAFDLVLLDLGLPESSGAATLSQFREMCAADIPVIVLTGLADDETALQALDGGAQDYLAKSDVTPDLLSRSIRYALQRHQLTGQLKTSNELLERKNRRLAQLCETAQRFVENVSHEFRTPLTVIREFTSIIRDGLDGGVTPKQAEHLDKVIYRIDDLSLLVDDMLDVSKLEVGLLGVWRRPCAAPAMIETVTGLVTSRAKTKQIRLEIAIAENLPLVYCDEEKARRVIINLAVNAIKFTPENGTVKIWASPGETGQDVVIGVTDSGPGISPENLAIIFERFKQVEPNLQASAKGFGLGLNIAKELAGLNLGRIDVESTVGAGSTFRFTLPKNEPRIVFERFLDRLSAREKGPGEVTLIAADIDVAADPSLAPVADDFLQRSVRPGDLAVHYDCGRWIIAAECPEADCERLVARLQAEWANVGRNCPDIQVAPLRLRRLTTGSVDSRRRELMRAFARRVEAEREPTDCGRKILVVDDDHEVSQCLGVRLRAAGFTVLSAYDGDKGIAAALAERPDAIVLDVLMPNKDGLTVLRELRAHPTMRRTPIVVLSASVRDQHCALEAGASYFIPKPYEAKDVLAAIESSMSEEVLA